MKGNRIEERVGQRTTIELLNAELELAQTRLNLVDTRHDEYIASAALLSAMGLLEARFLVPYTQVYDPAASLRRVEDRYAPPWEDAVGKVDQLGAQPATAPPAAELDATVGSRPVEEPAPPK